MSRWKPASPRSSPYITEQGYDKLSLELQQLWEKRKTVTEALAAAAAEGDRSENAEYIYRKKELRGLDRRIRYLQKRLPTLTVVRQKPSDSQRIFFGAWVTLEKEDGKTVEYRIVGADEIETGGPYISIDSPLAKALLKKSVDDEVTVTVESTATYYTVTEIDYR